MAWGRVFVPDSLLEREREQSPPSFPAPFCPSRPFSLEFAHPSVIRTPPVILSEAKNLPFRLYGQDAGGVRQRIESKPFFPSPRPSPSRGEGGRCPSFAPPLSF